MKTKAKILIVILTVSLFTACEKSDNLYNDSNSQLNENEISLIKSQVQADFNKEILNQTNSSDCFFSDNFMDDKEQAIQILNNRYSITESNLKSTMDPIVHGPYSTTMPSTKILSNYKMYMYAQPGLAAGIYFCDIYRYAANINLPSGAVGYVNSVNPQGFSNYSTQTPGYYSATSSGTNIFTVGSYKIHVKYNVLGQSINKVFPSSLNNVNTLSLSYSYITF